MSVKSALLKYHAKDAASVKRKSNRAGKKNGKPEKALEKLILAWAELNNLFLHVIESKAVYSASAGRYLRGQAEAGLPDLIGNFEGFSVWVELKAKGRRGTLKEHQRAFLVRKIEQGCFACCVESVDQLSEFLNSFLNTPVGNRKKILMEMLPKKRSPRESDESEELF